MSEPEARVIDPRIYDMGYSLRRYYVDCFFERVQPPACPAEAGGWTWGGTRCHKRGQFDIEKFGLSVVFANLSAEKRPHVQSDAMKIAFRDESFDLVICAELLEHVREPLLVLGEVGRVLRGGGRLLITAPFMYRIHGDPCDYARYTDHYWREVLTACGFRDIHIVRQGRFWSVWFDMLRDWGYQRHGEKPPLGRCRRWLVEWLAAKGKRRALAWEAAGGESKVSFRSNYTTGFGIQASKPE